MMIGDAMTPLTPRLTPSSMLFNIEFDVTVFDVPVFDVTHLYPNTFLRDKIGQQSNDFHFIYHDLAPSKSMLSSEIQQQI